MKLNRKGLSADACRKILGNVRTQVGPRIRKATNHRLVRVRGIVPQPLQCFHLETCSCCRRMSLQPPQPPLLITPLRLSKPTYDVHEVMMQLMEKSEMIQFRSPLQWIGKCDIHYGLRGSQ